MLMLCLAAMKRARARGNKWLIMCVGAPLSGIFALACVFFSWSTTPHPLYAQKPSSSGDIIPIRQVSDPYPVFNGIAVDPANNLVAMTDVNRKSLLSYSRTDESRSREITPPRRQVFGPRSNVGFVAGVALDSDRKEILALNNDIEDTMIVLSYDAQGNAAPRRMLSVPHQAWGIAISRKHEQLAITIEIQEAVVIYRRDAKNVEAPMRVIRGPASRLADPHGVLWNDRHDEILVANHGNYRGLFKNTGAGCAPAGSGEPEAGEIRPPSITAYSADAKGDASPRRTIQGDKTRLDFPMGLADDSVNDEFAVANNGDNSVLVFARTANGNVAPRRILSGPKTGINRPMGVAIDPVNNELWVSNFVDHSALVFDREANGNAAPKRIIRSAPEGTPSPGFGNPQTVAYDSKRDQILVPN
jgi:DNA-binding beta-propeller fold protein YncE